jgi:peptide/nickel transport system substrate-binding protein
MRRRAAGLLLAATIGPGCASEAAPDPQAIVVGLGNAPANLDPGVALDEASQRVHQLLFSSLLKFDDNLHVVPDLATRFETTDGRVYVAEIPAGVPFHDGRELTAEDVAYTFRRFLDPAFVSGRKGAYSDLERVEVLDRYTVAFHLRAPSAAFPSNVTSMGIVPVGTGSEASRQPIGSGPYRLVEFIPDASVTLAAFEDYYRGAPRNAGVVLKVVPDETMRGLELRKGDVDIVVNDIAPDIVHALAGEPQLSVQTGPGLDFGYIGINLRDPVLADRRVRQAISFAVDRTAIVRHLRRGLAQEAAGILPPISWAYASDVEPTPHDPARAGALLDEAGLRDPDGDGPAPRLHLTLKTSTAETYRLQAAVIQEQLAEVGIDLEIKSYEFATLFADVIGGNVQLYTLVFVGGSVANPDILRRVFHSAQIPPLGFNRGHYRNPEVDRLLDAATGTLDRDVGLRAYLDVQRLIAGDVPVVSLWTRRNVVVAQRDLEGITLSPLGDYEFLRLVERR